MSLTEQLSPKHLTISCTGPSEIHRERTENQRHSTMYSRKHENYMIDVRNEI